jgi:hypothetical protein
MGVPVTIGLNKVIVGIDTSNEGLIHTFTPGSTSSTSYDEEYWTATEDCWIVGTLIHNSNPMTNNTAYVSIDNITVASTAVFVGTAGDSYAGVCAPVKKGQVVKVHVKKGQLGYVMARKPLF